MSYYSRYYKRGCQYSKCDKQFEPAYGTCQKYCSKAHKQAAYRENKAAKAKAAEPVNAPAQGNIKDMVDVAIIKLNNLPWTTDHDKGAIAAVAETLAQPDLSVFLTQQFLDSLDPEINPYPGAFMVSQSELAKYKAEPVKSECIPDRVFDRPIEIPDKAQVALNAFGITADETMEMLARLSRESEKE